MRPNIVEWSPDSLKSLILGMRLRARRADIGFEKLLPRFEDNSSWNVVAVYPPKDFPYAFSGGFSRISRMLSREAQE